jgi:hypothetical protein
MFYKKLLLQTRNESVEYYKKAGQGQIRWKEKEALDG